MSMFPETEYRKEKKHLNVSGNLQEMPFLYMIGQILVILSHITTNEYFSKAAK